MPTKDLKDSDGNTVGSVYTPPAVTNPSSRTKPESESKAPARTSQQGSLELENAFAFFEGFASGMEKAGKKDDAERFRRNIEQAKEAITALHDAEIEYVIGEDENPRQLLTMDYGHDIKVENRLRYEQRKRWEERNG